MEKNPQHTQIMLRAFDDQAMVVSVVQVCNKGRLHVSVSYFESTWDAGLWYLGWSGLIDRIRYAQRALASVFLRILGMMMML